MREEEYQKGRWEWKGSNVSIPLYTHTTLFLFSSTYLPPYQRTQRRTHTPMSTSNGKIKLGQYNIIKTIGTGSFGKVKRNLWGIRDTACACECALGWHYYATVAVHAITGQKVALKFINKKKIASMDLGGRVKREIQYLKLLRHPHIIKL